MNAFPDEDLSLVETYRSLPSDFVIINGEVKTVVCKGNALSKEISATSLYHFIRIIIFNAFEPDISVNVFPNLVGKFTFYFFLY